MRTRTAPSPCPLRSEPRRPGPAHRRLALLVTLTMAVPLAACGDDAKGGGDSASVPGVTDAEIVVGTHTPLTGPAAPGYSKIAPATKAYFDYVNASGGIHGRKITYKIMDDGYDPSKTQQVVRELVLQDKVFALLNGLGTATHTGVLDFLKTNRVPDLFVASGSRSWNQPEKYPGTFGFQPDYTAEGKIIGTYLKQNHAGQKICHFGQNDDFGTDSLAGVEKILGASGVVAREQYVPTNPNVTPQIGKLKAAGCQVTVLASVPGFTALALSTAARAGFQTQWVVSTVGGDYATLAERLKETGAPLLEGMISAFYLVGLADENEPWNALFRRVNREHNGNAAFDNYVLYGMAVGYAFVQALQVTGAKLTRDGLLRTLESGKLTPGPGLTPFRYSGTDHSGYSGMQIARTTGRKQLPIGPVLVTDDRDAPVTESAAKVAPPPANGVPG